MTNIPLDTYIIALILLQRKGASSWLAILPLDDYEFYLHKEEFCDSLCLRYEWSLTNTSQKCNCAATLTVCHAIVCHMGGLTTQHSKIWHITASPVSEVRHNVTTKPHFQPIKGKRLTIQLAHTDNNARTDVCARRFTSLDIKMFHPMCSIHSLVITTACYCFKVSSKIIIKRMKWP